MIFPLPVFVAIPLLAAFLLPIFGKKAKTAATVLANAATISLLVLAVLSIGQSRVYEIGEWSIPLGINLVLDGLSSLLLLAIGVVSTTAMLFSVRYMEQYTAKAKYMSLFLLMVAGMNGVVLSGDIFNLFVFLEIASLASYALVGFGGGYEELEASFKYMVLGSIGSIFILFGAALVYGNTGLLNMAYISRAIQDSGLNSGLTFALTLFIVGFSLKAALVPVHAWLPDAHPSAPAPISAMLSGILIKTLGVYALARVVFNVFGISVSIGWLLVVLGILSMVAGAFLAIGQEDLKRLMAYSSISQIGYVVLGIGLGGLIIAGGGSLAWASLAILGGLFHLINHAVYKSLLFLTSGSVQMATGTRQLKQMGGLAEKLPVTRTTCTVASASIVGIPPFSGFWSKLILVVAAVQAGFYWVAAIIVFVSLCTLIMYLKVQRYVFLGELPEKLQEIKESKGTMLVAMIFLACLCVLMGLLLLVPDLKQSILDPAVKVLTDGPLYSANVIGNNEQRYENMRRLIYFILAFIIWVVFTWPFAEGKIDIQTISAGLIASAFVAVLFHKLPLKEHRLFISPVRMFWFLVYIPVFFYYVIKANLDVVYRALHPKMPIKPGIVKIKTNLKTESGITALANSITLTPGTLTVDLTDDGCLYIHWINVKSDDVEQATKFIAQRFEWFLQKIFE